MKGVIGFVKSNLIVVASLALALAAIPAMLFFAFGMNAKVRESVRDDASKAMSSLNNIPVTYEVPAATPDGEPWSLRRAPNELLNEAVGAQLERLARESEAVRSMAVEWNSRGKAPMIGGDDPSRRLFPEPANESARVNLLTRLADMWPGWHADLLREARAGSPPDPQDVAAQLQAQRARLTTDIVRDREDQELSESERAEVSARLAEQRLASAARAASDITVYADASVFESAGPAPGASGVPTMEQAWEWQWLAWIHGDVIAAVRAANSTAESPWVPVTEAPIKRLLSIRVTPFGEPQVDDPVGGGRGGGAAGSPAPSPTSPTPVDYSVSPTGRGGWPDVANGYYDVRYVDVRMVADVLRMRRILDAFSTTNFTTVIDVDIEAIEPGRDLGEGYVYGDGHHAEVSLRLETVWIREWMTPLMPAAVRETLGIPPDPEDDDDAG